MPHPHLRAVTIVGAMTISTLTGGVGSETRVVAQDLPTAERQFDAASVKVHRTPGGTTRRIEQDRLTYLNITLGELIQIAYNAKHYQIEAPRWVIDYGSSDRYDVIAKAAMPASPDSVRAMVAPLLADRFHLVVHRETRVLPVYVLAVAKGGPRFKEGDGGETLVMPDGSGAMTYQNYPMAALATLLSLLPTTGRPVLDRTGLSGRYTFTANLQNVPAGLTGTDQKIAIIQSDTPAFTALQEQLGLKLEPDRAPIEMIVVDRAEKVPTDD
jgi:uncharacterized protein (TIGR03435 family)